MMDTTEKLNRLSELQSQADVIRLHFGDLKAQILTPELQIALDEIDAEMNTSLESLQEGINSLTAEIKDDVIKGCVTVKGNYLMAVWNKGRISWDTKGLDGYAVAHPEMVAFRKEGDPSVTIRKA
jgi:hypothetical protein